MMETLQGFERQQINMRLYQLCLLGERPAVMLAFGRREQLCKELAEEGFSPERIAQHTRLSLRQVRRYLGA